MRRPVDALAQAPSTRSMESVLAPLSQRYILVYPVLQGITGSAKSALMLSQMLFWTRTYLVDHPERGGWFWHTQHDWHVATGLSRHEQDHARRALLATGFVTERLAGVPARLHFRVDLEALGGAIARHAHAQASYRGWRWDDAAMKVLLGRPVAFQRGFVDVGGSVTAALYLSELCQQQRTVERNALHGHISLNNVQRELDAGGGWMDLPLGGSVTRLGLTKRRLSSARLNLQTAGLIEERSSGGLQPRTLSRVNLRALASALAKQQKKALVSQPVGQDGAVESAFGATKTPNLVEQQQQVFDLPGMAETYIPEVTKPANWIFQNRQTGGD
jgi:hypothetical protein